MNKSPMDNQDFKILNIVATGEKPLSSWEVCQKLFPGEKEAAQNHLSSVICRLNKLSRMHALKKEPHPTRENKSVYALAGAHFSIDGTVFIATPIGGFIMNCRFRSGCSICKFNTPKCKLADVIREEGLEPALKIAEILSKNPQKEEEQVCQTPLQKR